MSSLLDQCEEFFGVKDLYKLFGVQKTALEKDITKAYYKLALKVHPDRVREEEKELATEKFKVLSKLHLTLTTKEKRTLYDEQGIVGDDDDSFGTGWSDIWVQFFKPITDEDIDKFEKQYIGSETEKRDILKAYLGGKGCMNYMFNHVPFITVESEPRIIEIVKKMIADGEVPEYKALTEEPKAKRNRRHKKYKREAEEAKQIQRDLSGDKSLEQMILKRQNERQQGFGSFLDRLEAKYANEDDEAEEDDDSELYEPKPSKRKPRAAAKLQPKSKKVKK